MLELSKMQGCTVRSWVPLGLFLVCLHLPGLFARSIGAAEEKSPQDLGPNLPQFEQPSLSSLSNAEHPQLNPVSESEGAPLNHNISPSAGYQPTEYLESQGWPLSEGLPPTDSWSYEDPWWMISAADEDYAGEALPEELSFLSGAVAHPLGGDPLPAGPSTHSPGDLSKSSLHPEARQPPRPSVLGGHGRILAHRPFWSLINKIRQSLLSGRPWGTLNPARPWGAGGLGTGWGTRPMPNLLEAGGIKNQYPSTSWGGLNRFPGTSWGNINQLPGGIWGNINRLPGGIWENINRLPGGIWGNINRLPGGIWGNINRLPGGIWGNINRLPGGIWGNINRLPGTSWGNIHVQPGGNHKFPAGVLQPPSSSWDTPVGLSNPENPGTQ